MEERTLLTTSVTSVVVDGLQLNGTFSLNSTSNQYQSTGTVYIGYSENYSALLSTDGAVSVSATDATVSDDGVATIPASSGTTSFTIAPATTGGTASLALYSLTENTTNAANSSYVPPTFWTTSGTATFDIGSLTGTGQSLSSGTAVAFDVASVPFDATNLAFTGADTTSPAVLLQGNLDFSSIGLWGLTVGVGTAGDGNAVTVTSGSDAAISLSGVEASVNAGFTAYGVGITGDITASFDADDLSFSFGGSVVFSAQFSTLGTVSVTASLGDDNPVVVDGFVQQISLTPTLAFDLFGLSLSPPSSSQSSSQPLLLEYTASTNEFEMSGSVTASVSDENITATFGTSSSPVGLAINADTGAVDAVALSVSGTFSVLGLGFTVPDGNPVTLVYNGSNEYEISGTVTVPTLFSATVTLGTTSQPGLTIDGGDWSVNNLTVSLSDVPLGAFEIQQFSFTYTQAPGSNEASVDVALSLSFPEGWDVDGFIDLGIDDSGQFEIDSFGVSWQADTTEDAIPIGDTGMFLTEMGASVQNFNQPSNLVVSGTMEAVFGQQVTIFGQQASFFQVDGNFSVNESGLSMSASVLYGAVTSGGKTTGLLGNGSGTMVLDWNNLTYSLSTTSSMLGGVFTYQTSFQFDALNSIVVSASAQVNVPHGIPVIGGLTLIDMSFLFEYQAPSSTGGQAQGFIAAWTTIDLYVTKVSIGIEYNYETDQVQVLGSGQISALERSVSSTTTSYTYSQSFTVPDGATQGTLEVDWTGNAVLSGTQPTTLAVEQPGDSQVTVTSSTTGTITLLQNAYTSSTQALVAVVGSTTNAYAGLTAGGTYTLYVTFTTSNAPTDTSADIATITEGPTSSEILVTFTSGVPSGIEVGDTVSVSGSSVDGYNANAVVQSITISGVVLNIAYAGADATGGSLSGWTLPQFSAAWYIPPPTISVDSAVVQAGGGTVEVSMTAQVASTLQNNATVDVYLAPYDQSTGTVMTASGTLVASDVPLTNATDNGNNQVGLTASALINLSGLLPTYYYFYAVVNDSVNPPVTSSYTGLDQVVENTAAISGTVLNQANEGLSGWTVFVDSNGNGVQDPGETSTTTDSSGYFGFYESQLISANVFPADTPVNTVVSLNLVLVNPDSNAFTFTSTSTGSQSIPYTVGAADTVWAYFTVNQQPSITGTVYLDENQSEDADGQQPLSGWTVFIDANDNGVLDPGEQWTVTNTYGAYGFYGLTVGTSYTVALMSNTGASAMYSFEAAAVSGTAVYDISGDTAMLQQTGTLNGGATVGSTSGFGITDHDYSGSDDQVLQLDGSTGYVSVPGTTGLQPGTGGFTVGGWIRGNQPVLGGNNPTIAGTIASDNPSGGWSLGLSTSLTFNSTSIAAAQTVDPFFVDTADFNGDGKLDILALSYYAEIYLNTTPTGATTPTFNADAYVNTQYPDNALNTPPVIADFNGDGKPDFAFAGNNNIYVFLNETVAGSSTLSFTTYTLAAANLNGGPLAAVSLNGSGQLPDLVAVPVGGPSMLVFMNGTTSGADSLNFSAPQTVALNFPADDDGIYQILTGDFNGDGMPDLAFDGESFPLMVLMNTTSAGAAAASFGTPQLFTPSGNSTPAISSVAVGDFNGDGKDDIAYGEWDDPGASDTLYILLSTTGTDSSTATFSTQGFAVGSNPLWVQVTDLNDDGRPDVAVANYNDGTVTVLINTTSSGATVASFSSATYDTAPQPDEICTGDFNGDGSTDLAVIGVGSEPLAILLNGMTVGSTTPNFTSSLYAVAADTCLDMVTGDFLNNGIDGLASSFNNPDDPAVTVTTVTAQTYLTAEVQQNSSMGSGSFSIVGNGTSLDIDTWYYVAFTYAPNVNSTSNYQLTLYVNGQQVGQATGLGTLPFGASISSALPFSMLFGAQPGSVVSQFFGGYLDDLSVWPSALTQQQIQALYGGGTAPAYVQTTPTNPNTYTTDLEDGDAVDNIATVSFGQAPSATITGLVTGTALGSTTAEPLAGWTVNLVDTTTGEVVATTVTGSTGYYFFFGVMWSDDLYAVEQVLEGGWTQSSSTNATSISVTLADVTGATPYFVTANFVNAQSAQVTGNVYVDANNDAVQDDGEVGAQGATVYLDENNNGQLDENEPTAVTQEDGTYAFTGLAPGQYTVRVVESSLGAITQPSTSSYVINVAAQGSVDGLAFGLSPLSIAPIANVTVAEGSPVSFTVTVTQTGSGQPPIFYLAPGAPAGATINPSTGVFSWTPTTPGTYTITVNAVAAGTPLLTDSQTFTITVTDVPPVVHLGSKIQITLGDPFVRLGSFTDPGTDPWTATVDYGDGRGPQPLLLGMNKLFELNHVYTNPGTYLVTVVVKDGEGGLGTASIAVVVLPTPPPPVSPSSGFGPWRDAFVTALFNNILGHGPDHAILSYWAGRLNAGASRRIVARGIWDSPEHRSLQQEHLAPRTSLVRAFRLAVRAEKMVKAHAATRGGHRGS